MRTSIRTPLLALALLLALSLPSMLTAQTLNVENDMVSIGGVTPTAPLDINIGSATPGPGNSLLRLERIGGVGFQMQDTNQAFFWQFSNVGDEFRISKSGTGVREFTLTGSGDLTVTGNVFSTTCTTPCAPDYVFEAGYELMPLSDLAAYIAREKHLPGVPSAEEMVGPVSLNQLQMSLLEKVEELTLYTLQQQETIEELKSRLEALER